MMEFHRQPHIFVSQVNIKVTNLAKSLAFYQHTIGLRILEQSERTAALTADGKTPLVFLEQPANVIPKQPRTTGLYHFALLLPNRSDLAKFLHHFIQSGYPLQGAADHLVSEALYFADPDGNGIEIYADRPASTWKWKNGTVEMTTIALDAENLLAENQGNTWNGLPANTIMGHIHLHVSELRATEEFYCKGLGFDIVSRYGTQALFISTGGYHHHIGLNTWNGVGTPAPSANSVGLKSFSLVLPNEQARQQVIVELQKIGASVTEENGVFLTKDPSGNTIELTV